MDKRQWLDGLSVGDEVCISGRVIKTVEKVTKTQITVDGVRYMKSDGWQFGYSTSSRGQFLMEPTSEITKKAMMASARKALFRAVSRMSDAMLPFADGCDDINKMYSLTKAIEAFRPWEEIK